MSAHVLLNLLNEFGERGQMRGLPSILLLFCNILRKFNNIGVRILSDIKITLKSLFGVKILRFCHCVYNIVMDA